MEFKLKYKRVWLAFGALFLVAIVVGIVFSIFDISPTPGPRKTTRSPVTTQSLTPTTLQKVRGWFGPWQLAASGETGSPALVMLLENGGADVSSWKMAKTGGWTPANPPEITAVTADENKITLQTNDGNIYTVSYGQPFILERFPDHVFLFRHVHSSYVILSTSVEQARLSGHKQ